MSLNSFTIIIRSTDRDNSTDNTNDCWIKLKCPSQYKYLLCEVNHFYITTTDGDVFNSDIFDLRSDNLNLHDHFDSHNTIAMNYFLSDNVANARIKFTTANFNNQRVHFQLFDENNTLVQNGENNYNHPWILILNCTGIQ
jgi:hypothetical protein